MMLNPPLLLPKHKHKRINTCCFLYYFFSLEYNNEHFYAKVREVFPLCHTDPQYDRVFNGVMDWFKALRWSWIRILNNPVSTSQPTCITKVTCTPLLRHLHTSSTNIQKDVFFFCLHPAFALFIHHLLPFLQHLSHSLDPI